MIKSGENQEAAIGLVTVIIQSIYLKRIRKKHETCWLSGFFAYTNSACLPSKRHCATVFSLIREWETYRKLRNPVPRVYFHSDDCTYSLCSSQYRQARGETGRSVRYGRIQQGTVFYVAALGNTNDYFLLFGRSRLQCLLHLVNVFRTKGRTLLL